MKKRKKKKRKGKNTSTIVCTNSTIFKSIITNTCFIWASTSTPWCTFCTGCL